VKKLLIFLTLLPFCTQTMEHPNPQNVIRDAQHNLITLGIGATIGTIFNLQNQNFFIQNVGGASFSYLAYLATNCFAEMYEGHPFNIGENILQFREQEALLLVAYLCTVLSVKAVHYMHATPKESTNTTCLYETEYQNNTLPNDASFSY